MISSSNSALVAVLDACYHVGTHGRNCSSDITEITRAAKEVNYMRDFFSDNWQTIVLAAATTIVVRLLLGW